mgnify:CR=1 FL=1
MFTNQQINIDALPTIDDVNFKPVSKQYLKIIILNRSAIYLIVMAALWIAKMKVIDDTFQNLFWYILAAVMFIAIANLIFSIVAFKTRKYAIREQDVIYTKGFLVNSIAAVPISRIQHLEISRTWLARKLNLATLNIFTAGESGIDLSIEGLNHSDAKKINDYLSERVNGTT